MEGKGKIEYKVKRGQVLPFPGGEIVGRLERMFKCLDEGGLKLTNLICFYKVLKLSWLKRLISGDW